MHDALGGTEVEHSELWRRLSKLEKDMWLGNGKPGLTTRMATVENILETNKEAEERRYRKQDRIEILLWGAIIAGIANLIFSHLR